MPDQETMSALATYQREHEQHHRQEGARLDRLEAKLDDVRLYLTGNGRITIGMSGGRLRFAGSLSWRKWMTGLLIVGLGIAAERAGLLAELVALL